MAKVVDITSKLSFEERPKLKIKDKEIEIRNDSATVLQVMQVIGDGSGIGADEMLKCAGLLFTKEGKKAIEDLALPIDDYGTVIRSAIDVLIGAEDEENA